MVSALLIYGLINDALEMLRKFQSSFGEALQTFQGTSIILTKHLSEQTRHALVQGAHLCHEWLIYIAPFFLRRNLIWGLNIVWQMPGSQKWIYSSILVINSEKWASDPWHHRENKMSWFGRDQTIIKWFIGRQDAWSQRWELLKRRNKGTWTGGSIDWIISIIRLPAQVRSTITKIDSTWRLLPVQRLASISDNDQNPRRVIIFGVRGSQEMMRLILVYKYGSWLCRKDVGGSGQNWLFLK